MAMQDPVPGDDMHASNRQPVFLDRESAADWLGCTADYAPLLRGPTSGTLMAEPPEPAR